MGVIFLNKVILITLIVYLACFMGFAGGMFFSAFKKNFSANFNVMILGFTAGILNSYVCFEVLPLAFEAGGLCIGIVSIVLGVTTATILENKKNISTYIYKENFNLNFIKTGILINTGLMLHKIPEGIVLGSMLNYNLFIGLFMVAIICIHCFPQGVAITLSMNSSGLDYIKIFIWCFILSVPMSIGSLIGVVLTSLSPLFTALSMSFSSGIIIYITCGEILPETKKRHEGSLTALFAALGFILGVILTL